jgi:hypothetical protein
VPVATTAVAEDGAREELLDLKLDLATPPPLVRPGSSPPATDARAATYETESSKLRSSEASSKPEPSACGCDEPPLLRFDSRIWAYSAVADLICYFALRALYNGKVAMFVATTLVALMALVSTIVMRIHCDRCHQMVNKDALPSTQRQNFNIRRAKMVGITLFATALAAFFYWNMTSKTWREELADQFDEALYLDWQAGCEERVDCGEFANKAEFAKRLNANPPDQYMEDFLNGLDGDEDFDEDFDEEDGYDD